MAIIPEVVESDDHLPPDLVALRKFAYFMDEAVPIPGTRRRVGIDAGLSLIPGVGEVIGGLLSAWIIVGALRHRVPLRRVTTMLLYVLLDMSIGSIPVAGTIFDWLFEENVLNLNALLRYRDRTRPPRSMSEVAGATVVVFVIILAAAFILIGLAIAAVLWHRPTLMFFRKHKPPRYPRRPPLPVIRKLPMRYHMRHQFGVRDLAFSQTMYALTGTALSEGNRIDILKNGDQIFPAMLAAIRTAKKTINLEFYIYWDGQIGRTFAEALAERARAGVAVKIILDAVGSSNMSQSLIDFMARNGIDQEWYHPIRWYTLNRVNHRTHRKLLIVDGCVGFSGGVGIADDWLGNADSKDHWRDTVVRVEGPVVTQMQFAFMDNWVKSRGELLTGLDYFPTAEAAGPHMTQVIKSSPSEGVSTVKLMYIVSIVSAMKSIYISNAYFVPDHDTTRALEGAVRRGVDVRVIVPGEHVDVPIVREASRWHYGSSNFDDRSFRLNDEVNVNIYDEGIAQQMEAMFFDDLKSSEEIKHRAWLRRPRWSKVKETIADLLKPQL